MKFLWSGKSKFEIVNEVPNGYFIWNIGTQNMVEGYIPLCQWLNNDKDNYSINVKTLKTIKVSEGWEEIMSGTCWVNAKNFDKLVDYVKCLKDGIKKTRIENLIKYLPQINGYEKLSWRR